MFGSPLPGEYIGLGFGSAQWYRDLTYGSKACTFISIYTLLKMLVLDSPSKTALLELLPFDDWVNLSCSVPAAPSPASPPRPRAHTTTPASSAMSASDAPARMRSHSIVVHPTYQQTLQVFSNQAINDGIRAHKQYCVDSDPPLNPQDYKLVSVAALHCEANESLLPLANGGISKVELTTNFFDLDKSGGIVNAQNGARVHYEMSSQQLFALQQPFIAGANPQKVDSYAFVLGAQNHAIAVVKFYNHWFLFNSLGERLLSTEAYIRYFTSTDTFVDYLQYLYRDLPSQGNGMQGGGIQYNLYIKKAVTA